MSERGSWSWPETVAVSRPTAADAETLPDRAETFDDPVLAAADANPSGPIVTTAAFDELQVTSFVRSAVP